TWIGETTLPVSTSSGNWLRRLCLRLPSRTSGGGGGAARFGGNPGGSEWSPSAAVPSATARLFAASTDPESWPVRARAGAATAPRAALSDAVWSDLADLLFSGPWLDALELPAGS